ncbi:membrane protein [Klebsiella pneumoniae]|uniref:Membrane protein n=1 Tax=Klebsiella pneumoniae TaxID=573 RepID=A0A2X3HAK9_KLEPN|nr:membrane protein [Klebsiella pneumoniae]
MTAEGHLFFSIACAVFAKNAELTPVLAQGDWWHIVPSAVLTCLLPDIDHPKSFLGQRLSWISKPVARAFGHRGFTHSLLAVFGALTLFYLKVPDSWIVPADALQGLVLGYLSHILADMLTPAGVPLLWPCRWRFRLPILAPRKGQSARTRLVYGAVRLCRLDAADAGGQQRDTLVIRGDQFPADHLQSLYKSPEWAIKRRKTPFGYNPFHLNISP